MGVRVPRLALFIWNNVFLALGFGKVGYGQPTTRVHTHMVLLPNLAPLARALTIVFFPWTCGGKNRGRFFPKVHQDIRVET